MGAAAIPIMVLATLGGGYMQGRTQQRQANAAAAQAEANANLMQKNAEMQRNQAIEQDKNNKINEENANRQRRLQLAAQQAKIGAAGITATGSALNALADSKYNMEMESAIQSSNNRTTVDNMLNKSGEYDNQADIYRQTASDYRAAGKKAMTTSMVGAGLSILAMGAQTSLNSSLYSSNSAAATSGGLPGTYANNYGQGALSSTSASYANNYGRGWIDTGFGYSGKSYKVGQGIG